MNNIIGFHLPSEPYGFLSNWYTAPFSFAHKEYCCIEQYMMFQKVALGGRYDLVDKIMKTSDPATMKEYAGKEYYDNYSTVATTWEKIRKNVIKRGIRAKFQQNSELLTQLLDTGNAILAECSASDTIWGIGINLHDKKWRDVENWRGSNLLGIILMELRQEFKIKLSIYRKIEFTDYSDYEANDIWKLKPIFIERIPQYYEAIHTYSDQLSTEYGKDSELSQFLRGPLSEWETAMLINMGGGLPIAGFYEMKQEIYEITENLNK